MADSRLAGSELGCPLDDQSAAPIGGKDFRILCVPLYRVVDERPRGPARPRCGLAAWRDMLAQITARDLELASPNPGWDVAHVINHSIAVTRKFHRIRHRCDGSAAYTYPGLPRLRSSRGLQRHRRPRARRLARRRSRSDVPHPGVQVQQHVQDVQDPDQADGFRIGTLDGGNSDRVRPLTPLAVRLLLKPLKTRPNPCRRCSGSQAVNRCRRTSASRRSRRTTADPIRWSSGCSSVTPGARTLGEALPP